MYRDASYNHELPAEVMLGLHYGVTAAMGSAVDYLNWKFDEWPGSPS
ncbi:MAG: hypothetical protein Q7U80_01070 [Thiobacillus sp.]|nr:hypothetical protein [Gammaproteobacteria bacterium]MBU4500157.1 hypothetical protein [Gammaproteobacteria bacterium]MDO9006786.1 hypothetical protein [Thiobacillus sp.]MDP3126280.1 hypothetical protein [Thiobacillus sp.]